MKHPITVCRSVGMDLSSLTLVLNDGNKHPMIGYGTYKVGVIPASASGAGGASSATGTDPKQVVRQALDVGYRFLDCAQFYNNEKGVGEAIQEVHVRARRVHVDTIARCSNPTHPSTWEGFR